MSDRDDLTDEELAEAGVADTLEAEHQRAHQLALLYGSVTETFSEAQEIKQVTALYAAEMFASMMRRTLRDMGMSKPLLKKLQTHASQCGRGEYERLGLREAATAAHKAQTEKMMEDEAIESASNRLNTSPVFPMAGPTEEC